MLKGEGKGALHLFAFDLLSVEGEDLTWQPNISRKEKLAALLGQGSEHVHFSDHIIGAGEKLFRTMCEAGQEGIICKRADAPYRGARTKNWLKVKCTRRQEFVIVGWTPSSASGRAIRNILLAQNDDQGLVYAGKVGTGFNARNSDQLLGQLKARARQSPALNVQVSFKF